MSYSPKILLKKRGVCRILPYSLQYLGFEGVSNSPNSPNDMFSGAKKYKVYPDSLEKVGCTERFKNKNK